jgi:hypothetical protein
MAGLRESGVHVPPIDFSTTYPLPDVDRGGLAYEELATGHDLGPGRSAVYQRLWQPGVARFEDALADLEAVDPRAAQVVVLRFFSGMSTSEVAEHLALSVRTIEADWTHARAWLKRQLSGGRKESSSE